jgi:protein-tyrosine phosphatase
MSRLFWIDLGGAGRLAIMARPRAGDWLESEVDEWKTSGIDVVVSLLERQEVVELELHREAELCRSRGIDFVPFPIPDRGVPEAHAASQIAHTLAAGLRDGRSIAIHCRAGIGRSSVMAACALIAFGVEAEQALALIKSSPRPERAGHRCSTRLGDRLRQRRNPHGAQRHAGLILSPGLANNENTGSQTWQ